MMEHNLEELNFKITSCNQITTIYKATCPNIAGETIEIIRKTGSGYMEIHKGEFKGFSGMIRNELELRIILWTQGIREIKHLHNESVIDINDELSVLTT
jgi:hypothetical protein